jgi:hypothetical protein
MKTVKPIMAAAILSLVLNIPAYAGDIHTPGYTDPQISGDIDTPGDPSTDPGDIHTPGLVTILFAVFGGL